MKKILIPLLILCIILISGCIEQPVEGTYEADYYGTQLLFNSNLDEAQNISVIPDEETLKETLFGYNVASIRFAYHDNDTEAPYYIKSLASFASKYVKINMIRWKYDMRDEVFYTILNENSYDIQKNIEQKVEWRAKNQPE